MYEQVSIPPCGCTASKPMRNGKHSCRIVFVFTERTEEVEQFLVTCELSRLMQELIGSYIMMEEYFMREMVVKVF